MLPFQIELCRDHGQTYRPAAVFHCVSLAVRFVALEQPAELAACLPGVLRCNTKSPAELARIIHTLSCLLLLLLSLPLLTLAWFVWRLLRRCLVFVARAYLPAAT